MDMQTAKAVISDFNEAIDDMSSPDDFDAVREEFDSYDAEFRDVLTMTVKEIAGDAGPWTTVRQQWASVTNYVKALADLDDTITRGEQGEFE